MMALLVALVLFALSLPSGAVPNSRVMGDVDAVVPEAFSMVSAMTCDIKNLGDGRCDRACNSAKFQFDHGDCCLATCRCGTFECGVAGFNCVDAGVASQKASLTFVDAAAIQKAHNAAAFTRDHGILHVRRGGGTFELTVNTMAIPDRGDLGQLQVVVYPVGVPSAAFNAIMVTKNSGTAASCYKCVKGQASTVLATCASSPLLTAKVTIPVDAPVGLYTIAVHGAAKLQAELTLFVMFNPWHNEDPVYLPSDYLRKEHIMQESAGICTGTDCHSPIVWGVDQFTPTAVATASLLLATLPQADRSHPQLVARHLAWKLNTQVAKGKWSGSYADGTSPTWWVSSIEILDKFVASKQQVKYAQCWVFAGLMATLLRATGIPSRIVSGQRVAVDHTKPADARMMRYWELGKDGQTYHLDESKSDGMWYYHVWNDVWMSRSDLTDVPIGWQALDATPQKWSIAAGAHTVLGPASVDRIKQLGVQLAAGDFDDHNQCRKLSDGESLCKRDSTLLEKAVESFDEAFMVSEVSADKLEFTKPFLAPKYTFSTYTANAYGSSIATQKPASSRGTMIDVTCDYKQECPDGTELPAGTSLTMVPEPVEMGSPAPAGAFLLSLNRAEQIKPDLHFSMPSSRRVRHGRKVTIQLTAKLLRQMVPGALRTVNVRFVGYSRDNRGSKEVAFWQSSRSVVLSNDHPEVMIAASIPRRHYQKYLMRHGHNAISFSVSALTKETQQLFTTLDDRPSVTLTLPAVALRMRKHSIQASWTNPQRNRKLCGCVLKLHVIGTEQMMSSDLGCIQAGKHIREEHKYHRDSAASLVQAANAVLTCSGGFFASGFASL